jgi:hypothetical protein
MALGELPVRHVGAPEKTELLDEAVKVVQVLVVSQISDYPTTLPTDIFIFETFFLPISTLL